jgi:HlyD family secretion protein
VRSTTLLLALSLALAGCGRDPPLQVLGTVERDRIELVAESNERIVEIPVREGDRVAEGQVVVRQEAGVAEPRLAQARAAQAEAQRRLADLEQGPRAREIDEARAALAGAEGSLRTDQQEYERVQALVRDRMLSESSLDQARARREGSLAARDQARARLELLRQGTRPQQVEAARAAMQRATAALDELETVTARYTVRAPRAALVEALPYELGERPAAGRAVAILLADGAPYARVYVPEPLLTRFVAGTRVEASVDGEAGRIAGTVRFVSSEAAFTPYYSLTQQDRSRLAFLAEVTLDDQRASRLPAGVPVQVHVPEAPAPATAQP